MNGKGGEISIVDRRERKDGTLTNERKNERAIRGKTNEQTNEEGKEAMNK